MGNLVAWYRMGRKDRCRCPKCDRPLKVRCLRTPCEEHPKGVFEVSDCHPCAQKAAAKARRENPTAKPAPQPNKVPKPFRGLTKELTALHRRIRAEMHLDDLGFVPEQKVGAFRCDDVHHGKRIVVEVNGDYVHANPGRFKARDVIVLEWAKYTAREKWAADAQRIAAIERLGWRVLVVWESDNMEAKRRALYRLLTEEVAVAE